MVPADTRGCAPSLRWPDHRHAAKKHCPKSRARRRPLLSFNFISFHVGLRVQAVLFLRGSCSIFTTAGGCVSTGTPRAPRAARAPRAGRRPCHAPPAVNHRGQSTQRGRTRGSLPPAQLQSSPPAHPGALTSPRKKEEEEEKGRKRPQALEGPALVRSGFLQTQPLPGQANATRGVRASGMPRRTVPSWGHASR